MNIETVLQELEAAPCEAGGDPGDALDDEVEADGKQPTTELRRLDTGLRTFLGFNK